MRNFSIHILDCVGISEKFKEQEEREPLNTMAHALLILLLSTFSAADIYYQLQTKYLLCCFSYIS
jgi:hypothetical protein